MARHATGLSALLLDSAFDGEVLAKEPMSRHTSYRIGGPARYFVRADSIGALSGLMEACVREGSEYFIVGRGTNLLVSDDGYDGVVIALGRDFRNHKCDAETATITSGAAAPLSAIVQEALRQSLKGLEFAVGTPGSMGGAVKMNAGSREDWMGSVVESVTVFDPAVGLSKLDKGDVEWGYRQTSLSPTAVVLECELALEHADPLLIRAKMEANLSKRKQSQPLGLPSCGSVFKNPEGASAAKMIDDLGLKGLSRGGAQISEKHANFIVNTGDAKAADVVWLMETAKEKVEEAYGIELTPEVKLLGF